MRTLHSCPFRHADSKFGEVWSALAAEVADDLLGVPVLPLLLRLLARVVLVELHEHPGQLAPNGGAAQYLRQLGVIDQPVGVPGRPVVVGPVGDAEHLMVRLPSLVQQLADPLDTIIHVTASVVPAATTSGAPR